MPAGRSGRGKPHQKESRLQARDGLRANDKEALVLILSRKAGESILLHMRDGRSVDVKVAEIIHETHLPARVKLGITAPDDVLVLREEVPMRSGPRRPPTGVDQ